MSIIHHRLKIKMTFYAVSDQDFLTKLTTNCTNLSDDNIITISFKFLKCFNSGQVFFFNYTFIVKWRKNMTLTLIFCSQTFLRQIIWKMRTSNHLLEIERVDTQRSDKIYFKIFSGINFYRATIQSDNFGDFMTKHLWL
jgi:hypothetical protein